MSFLKRLFGMAGGESAPQAPTPPIPPSPPKRRTPTQPPLPAQMRTEFLDWFKAQRKPAVALITDPDLPIEPKGSRLFGPAFLQTSEAWPVDGKGEPLSFLAQINCADCAALEGYPSDGLIQFFIGRDDLYGALFKDLMRGDFVVRRIEADAAGALHEDPQKDQWDASGIDDYSPAYGNAVRASGIALKPEAFSDQMDLSDHVASGRLYDLGKDYDVDPLYDELDEICMERRMGHHTGGFPAFVQADIREGGGYAEYDHVLLRLTSDDYLMWGDAGECVFMMPGADLATGDFSRVIYSWDCS
ncbi:MAG: DUF1963 domain-containing protein [Erythrobacter sp.]